MSIRSRIMLCFMLLAVLLLVAVGLLAYRCGSQSLQDAAVSELLAVAVEKEAQLNAWRDARMLEITQLASETDVVQKAADLVAAGPGPGRQAAYSILQRELLPHIAGAQPDFLEVFVMEPTTGKVVVSTLPSEEAKMQAGHAYFDRGKTDLFFESPSVSAGTGAPAATIAVPLRAPDATLVAVMAFRLNLSKLNDITRRSTGLHATEDSYLVNAGRHLITRPRFTQESSAHQLETEPARRVASKKSGVMLSTDYRGVPVISVYRWLAAYQLGLLVEMDLREVQIPAHAFGRLLILIGIFLLAGTAVLAYLLARTLSAPVLRLQQRVQQFGEAEEASPDPARVHAGDEISALSREFERMSARVGERNAQLAKSLADLRLENAERKRAEEAIAAKTALLHNVINASPDFIIVKDSNLRTTLCNEVVARAIGKRPEALYGKTDLENGWPHEQVKGNPSKGIRGFEADDRQALEGHTVHNPSDPANVGNEVCYFDTLKVPLRDAGGAIVGVLAIARDVTARKRAEDALQRANTALEISAAVIENAAEGVMVIDASLHIVSVNPAFEKITGYSAAEVKGVTPRVLFSGKHDDAFFHGLHHVVDTKGHWQGEIWNRRRSGDIYPQRTTINTLRNAEGRITHYAALFSDNTLQNELEAKLREQSSIDGLTGIANRRTFDETFAQEWGRALRERRSLSLIMADIDHFKLYNDRYGHPAGDSCLQQVARAIASSVKRAGDLAARYGGEEFVVILPHTDAAGASSIAEKIRTGIAALRLEHDASHVAPFVTLSLGVATLVPQREASAAELVAAADRALYHAKESGRNRVVAETAGPEAALAGSAAGGGNC